MHLFELLALIYKYSLAALYYHLESLCLNKLIGVLFGRKKMLHVVVGIGKDICILVDHCLVSF